MVASSMSRTGAEEILWDLSNFYASPSDPRIDDDMRAVEQLADAFAAQYKGRMAELSAAELVTALKALEALYDRSGRLGSYANLMFSTDTADPQIGALLAKVQEYSSRIGQKLVFFSLEWNLLDDAQAQKVLDDPALGSYRHYAEAVRRYQPHQLSEIEEQLNIEKNVTGRSAWTRFFGQLTSSMRFDWDGEKINQSQILAKLHDPEREVRHKAADEITRVLNEYSMQTTYVFNVLAQDKASDDQRRKYPSWIAARNLSNKASEETVNALISAVTANYEIVARHYRLKRAIMGLDELTEYDRYAPLPVSASSEYTWDAARELVLSSFAQFSPRVAEIAERFFSENWIHAALLPNKRGGAFCTGTVPSAHPYVFMNYTGRDRDVMTLAHELGHGLHFYLSTEAQTLLNINTPLTTAEMASTFCEMLVFSALMSKESDPKARLAMLSKKIEDSFSTIFRQVAMNRFEDLLHTARRGEGELSTARLSEFWMQTQRAMFGDSVRLRDEYAIWWSYVPHFLSTPGYVYAYAFGELLVLALFNLYQARGAAFVPQYLDVLAAGDSDYPDAILAKVGVNLSDPGFWQEGIAALDALVTQEEALARELFPQQVG